MKGARVDAKDTPADVARAVLLQWAQGEPRAPSRLRLVAQKLAMHPDMSPAWGELAKCNVGPMQVRASVTSALEGASKETRRQTTAEERTGIERVARMARELKAAIEASPLPAGHATYITFEASGGESEDESERAAPVLVGWREIDGLAKSHKGFCPVFSICDVLELAEKLAQEHLTKLPPRAVARHRGRGNRPLQVAFVRWLAWDFGVRFGREFRGVVARVATALFDDSPLTKRDVDVILKDRPPAFVPPKRRAQKS